MPIKLCEYCEKPFQSLGAKICPECTKELDAAYIKTRKYIYQNAGPEKTSFYEIIEHTDVSEKALNYLIGEGRIVLSGKSGKGGTRCRACGTETRGDALCPSCRQKLISAKLLTVGTEAAPEPGRPAGPRVQPLSHEKR